MTGSVRIAVAQVHCRLGDLDANLEAHLETAERARGEGARLVVFPELSLTGYELRDLVPEVAIRPAGDPRLARLLEASRGIAIVCGFVEEADSHLFHNAAAWLEGGRIVHLHRKVHLPTYGMFDEGRFFAPGSEFAAFDTSVGRTGILICEDFWHPAASYVLALDGARCLVVPAASPTKETREGETEGGPSSQLTWPDLARVNARAYGVWTVFANRAGGEDQAVFAGGSFVMPPAARLLAQAEPFEEALLVTDMTDDEVRRARTRYPVIKDERPDIVMRSLARITGLEPRRRTRKKP